MSLKKNTKDIHFYLVGQQTNHSYFISQFRMFAPIYNITVNLFNYKAFERHAHTPHTRHPTIHIINTRPPPSLALMAVHMHKARLSHPDARCGRQFSRFAKEYGGESNSIRDAVRHILGMLLKHPPCFIAMPASPMFLYSSVSSAKHGLS